MGLFDFNQSKCDVARSISIIIVHNSVMIVTKEARRQDFRIKWFNCRTFQFSIEYSCFQLIHCPLTPSPKALDTCIHTKI